ncbi:MAG TPA: hypothetical protein DCL38_03840, partial [Lachnospiraceae bacterium]|nr:hypothetical protein [Lachnospiraceae bacterium]
SIVQTADGALAEMKDIVHRLKELSIRSANGTNTNEDRQAMQAEVSQLAEELTRITKQTEYNGQKLLNGDLGVKGRSYVLGTSKDYSESGIYGVSAVAVNAKDRTSTGAATYAFSSDPDGIKINGELYKWSDIKNTELPEESLASDPILPGKYMIETNDGVKFTLSVLGGSTTDQIGQSVNGLSAGINDSGVAGFDPNSLKPVRDGESVTVNPDGSTTVIGYGTMVYQDGDETVLSAGPDPGSTKDNVQDDIGTGLSIDDYNNHALEGKGKTLLIEDDENGVPQVKSFSGFPFSTAEGGKFETDPLSKTLTYSDSNGNELVLNYTDDLAKGKTIYLDVISKGEMKIQVGNTEGQEIVIRIPDCSLESMGIGDLDVTTAEEAKKSIGRCDAALAYLSRVSSRIGAIQNRFEANISNLNVSEENLTGSFSTIRDTDMAAEMVEYTKYQILTQAGVSILSQANELPQQALQLLQ